MKLTKLQRHTAYIIMLAEVIEIIRNKEQCFLCHVLKFKLGLGDFELEWLPELWNKNPGYQYAWFQPYDYEIRIKLLQQCIEETY